MAVKIGRAAGIGGLAGLFFLASSALALQPAAWAQDAREPTCIYDGLLASTDGPDEASNDARVRTIRTECMQRFGWTEGQAIRGFLVARIMVDMMTARREAAQAGVDRGLMESIFASFSSDDVASLGIPGQPVTPRAREVLGRLLPRRIAESGLRGEAATKASRAIVLQMMAVDIVADFAREVMAPPAPAQPAN